MSDGRLARIDEDRARHFEDLASAVELHADLRPNHRLASDWILTDYDYAAEARAFGEFWWLNLTTGCCHLVNGTAPSWPRLHLALTFDECISGMQQVLGHLISLTGQARHDARDGMTLARTASPPPVGNRVVYAKTALAPQHG